MTSELERIKILEGKIGKIVDYINELSVENEKLRQELDGVKKERKNLSLKAKEAGKLSENLKNFQKEREEIKKRIESIIGQIDKIGI
ncbi:MAG: cell division protein ZapB [Candidatus Nealsonbacteria bacterium]|nr:cell division protein ZapB [Candidatus Nealsonbacteria bacterium]